MTLEQLIYSKLSSLSIGQRRVAEYILQNLDSFSYATLAKLSKEISVSETTIIRLAYSLGFESFSSMQQKVRKEILTEPQRKSDTLLENGNFYQSVFAKEIRVLENMASRLDETLLNRVVDRLIQADRILVVGARASFNAASWFGTNLSQMLGNAYVVEQFYDPRLDLLTGLTEKSVVLCISFARYAKWSYQYSVVAKERGASLIAITDGISSPLIPAADEVLLADCDRDDTGFNSYVSMFCLFNAIIAKIRTEIPDTIAFRVQRYEELYQDLDLFFE